jgi:hypothetical protein
MAGSSTGYVNVPPVSQMVDRYRTATPARSVTAARRAAERPGADGSRSRRGRGPSSAIVSTCAVAPIRLFPRRGAGY